MQPKMIRNKFPPKFALANGFVIGSMPQVLQWTANGEKKSRVIAEHELTNLLKAMMAPVRPYGSIFSYRWSSKIFNSLNAKSVLAGEKLVATYSISTWE